MLLKRGEKNAITTKNTFGNVVLNDGLVCAMRCQVYWIIRDSSILISCFGNWGFGVGGFFGFFFFFGMTYSIYPCCSFTLIFFFCFESNVVCIEIFCLVHMSEININLYACTRTYSEQMNICVMLMELFPQFLLRWHYVWNVLYYYTQHVVYISVPSFVMKSQANVCVTSLIIPPVTPACYFLLVTMRTINR